MQIQEDQTSKAISITHASCSHSRVIILKLFFTQFGTSNSKSIKPQYFLRNTETGKSKHLSHVKKLNIKDTIHWIQHWYINTNHTNVLTTSVWINVIKLLSNYSTFLSKLLRESLMDIKVRFTHCMPVSCKHRHKTFIWNRGWKDLHGC